MHGRIIAGLFARCFEKQYGDDAFQFARLTVDLFRMPTMNPVRIATERVRGGRRIQVTHGVATGEGREIASATAVQLRRSEVPPGSVWQPKPWDAPPPSALEANAATGSWTPIWETRSIGGGGFIVGMRKRSTVRRAN